jgi:hypothetical protein
MRHRTRHIHQTVIQHVTDSLLAHGWINPPINYGSSPVEIQEFEPFGEGAVQPDGNLVAVTIEDSSEDTDEELGGMLISGHYMLYVDVVGETIPLSVAIADDLRVILKNRIIPVKDFTADPAGVAVEGMSIEFVEVNVDVPPAASSVDKRTWRVVSCLCDVFMPDDTRIPVVHTAGAFVAVQITPGG